MEYRTYIQTLYLIIYSKANVALYMLLEALRHANMYVKFVGRREVMIFFGRREIMIFGCEVVGERKLILAL